MNGTYSVEGNQYDVSKLAPAGQAMFRLLALAQEKKQTADTEATLANAALITLRQGMQEHLAEEALVEVLEPSTEETKLKSKEG
jgi:hypothetical protein